MAAAMPAGDPLLTWRDGVRPVPVSQRFNDPYFDADDGLAESRAVFLAGNDLPQRAAGRRFFAIGETGFGTGLNFLAAWQGWAGTAPPDGRLLFLSVDAYPLARRDLVRALSGWPELAPQAAALAEAYPPQPGPGLHRLRLAAGRVMLMLLVAEAAALSRLDGRMDAWFLDGFAPARNPQMWRPQVLAAVAALSGPGTTLASFTAAGQVRRTLTAAGFTVERRPGFQGKRHRIIGRMAGPDPAPPGSVRRAAVVGAGIAGASAAYALRRRGIDVTVVEAGPAAAGGASGNPAGIVVPNPTAGPAAAGAFSCAAFAETRGVIAGLTADVGQHWCGVLDVAADDPAGRVPRLLAQDGQGDTAIAALTAAAASDAAGVRLDRPAIRFATAGRVAPGALCAALLADCDLRCGTALHQLQPGDAGWRLLAADGARLADADLVVLATGPGVTAIRQAAWLPVLPRRGQVTLVPRPAPARGLRQVLSGGCYVLPAGGDLLCLGATYTAPDPADATLQAVRDRDHQANRAAVATAFPALGLSAATPVAGGRAALRATTPDRQPVVGPVPDRDAVIAAATGDGAGLETTGLPGLFVLGGLGSRGLTTAILAAEIIACEALGEPGPVLRDQRRMLHPARFLLRDLKRGRPAR